MLLLRSVVTGFGLALGAALFKKHVAKRLGLEENTPEKQPDETLARDVGAEPSQQQPHN